MQKLNSKTALNYIVFFIVFLTILFTLGCNPFDPDRYDVFIYPNGDDLTKDIYAGRYDSLDEARDVAQGYMEKYPNGEYEIGKNCNPDGLCEETLS